MAHSINTEQLMAHEKNTEQLMACEKNTEQLMACEMNTEQLMAHEMNTEQLMASRGPHLYVCAGTELVVHDIETAKPVRRMFNQARVVSGKALYACWEAVCFQGMPLEMCTLHSKSASL
eukprot:1150478-Pelagomonas_calceolata.AAC.22